MKKWLSVLLAVVLLVVSGMPTAHSTTYLICVPGAYEPSTYPAEIALGPGQSLIGKFYYPDSGPSGPGFAPNSLPGVLLTHGFGETYADVEGQAAALARNCMVALTFNYFGQGWDWEISTEFEFYTEGERDSLAFAIDRLKRPIIDNPDPEPDFDLVDDTRLGMLGYSQAGIATWMALADPNLRSNFRAVAMQAAAPYPSGVFVVNDCLNANLANILDPARARAPAWTPGAPTPPPPYPTPVPGAIWEPGTYAQLYNAYVAPDLPAWKTALAPRDFPVTQLAQTGTPGTPHPHTYIQASWYDSFQLADEAITPWATLTTGTPVPPPTTLAATPTPAPQPPFHRLRIGPGGHVDAPWKGSIPEQLYRFRSPIGWLWTYLQPTYAATPTPPPGGGLTAVPTPTPTRTPTGPSPTSTPEPVEYVVDSYNQSASAPLPTFEFQAASQWPPAETTPVTLYLHSGGQASEATPGPEEGYDVIGQVFTPGDPPYNLSTAVAEHPAFASWETHIAPTPQFYYSPPLAQDVTLLGAPAAHLYYQTFGPPGVDTFQIHVRVLEELTYASDPVPTPFITRANHCVTSSPGSGILSSGTFFGDEPRAHLFRAGDRIVLQTTTVDQEEYRRTHNWLFITPELASFSVAIWHQQDTATSVTLPLVPLDPGAPIFAAGGEGMAALPQGGPAGTLAPPEPLQIEAHEYPDFTGAGGWRAWGTRILFECAGGEGVVACPESRLILSEGANQSFTFEARDEKSNVASVTVSGLNIDRTPPQLKATLPETQTFCSGGALPLEFNADDPVSGLAWSEALFNGQSVVSGDRAPLRPGQNTLRVDAQDVAGNRIIHEASVQVNYAVMLNFPADGQRVDPHYPLPFHFTIADACQADGKYRGDVGTLWLAGPDGVETPAQWANGRAGNRFEVDPFQGTYTFNADVSGLAPGPWTARAHLDDGNDYSITFVVP